MSEKEENLEMEHLEREKERKEEQKQTKENFKTLSQTIEVNNTEFEA